MKFTTGGARRAGKVPLTPVGLVRSPAAALAQGMNAARWGSTGGLAVAPACMFGTGQPRAEPGQLPGADAGHLQPQAKPRVGVGLGLGFCNDFLRTPAKGLVSPGMRPSEGRKWLMNQGSENTRDDQQGVKNGVFLLLFFTAGP